MPTADLVIGAVLTPGSRAPTLVDEAAAMPGSVIVDVAIDQGSCIATGQETTHRDPTVASSVQHTPWATCLGPFPSPQQRPW